MIRRSNLPSCADCTGRGPWFLAIAMAPFSFTLIILDQIRAEPSPVAAERGAVVRPAVAPPCRRARLEVVPSWAPLRARLAVVGRSLEALLQVAAAWRQAAGQEPSPVAAA